MIKTSRDIIKEWPNNIQDAKTVQNQLRPKVILRPYTKTPQWVAGIDIGFESQGKITRGAIVLLSFPDLALQESHLVRMQTCFPYVPGYLSFRETPAALLALQQLTIKPDLILCDGQGIAHPRRFGLACHIGLLSGIAAIGVAKSRLIGKHKEPGPNKGDWQSLWDKNEQGEAEQIGAVLRTRDNVKPVFVSPGYLTDLKSSIALTLACTTNYRLPETTRHADKLASRR